MSAAAPNLADILAAVRPGNAVRITLTPEQKQALADPDGRLALNVVRHLLGARATSVQPPNDEDLAAGSAGRPRVSRTTPLEQFPLAEHAFAAIDRKLDTPARADLLHQRGLVSELSLEPQDDQETVDWGDSKFPPYVRSPEERERWDVCEEIAEATSRLHEPSGQPDMTFVWFCTRSMYRSDIRTGTAADRVEDGDRVIRRGDGRSTSAAPLRVRAQRARTITACPALSGTAPSMSQPSSSRSMRGCESRLTFPFPRARRCGTTPRGAVQPPPSRAGVRACSRRTRYALPRAGLPG